MIDRLVEGAEMENSAAGKRMNEAQDKLSEGKFSRSGEG